MATFLSISYNLKIMPGPLPSFFFFLIDKSLDLSEVLSWSTTPHIRMQKFKFKFNFSFYMALAHVTIFRKHCFDSGQTWLIISVSDNSNEEQLLRTWESKPGHEQAAAPGAWWQPSDLSPCSRSTEICTWTWFFFTGQLESTLWEHCEGSVLRGQAASRVVSLGTLLEPES